VITSCERGHPVYFKDGRIFYRDTGEEVDWNNPRPCPRCGRLPTPEGHDACLGTLPGVKSACCGHGVTEAIVVNERGKECPPK